MLRAAPELPRFPHWVVNGEGVCSFFIRAEKTEFLEVAHLDLARRMGFNLPSDNLVILKTDILQFLRSGQQSLEWIAQGDIGPLFEYLKSGEHHHREDFLLRWLPQAFLDFDLVKEIPEYRATVGLAPYYFAPGQRENYLRVYWRVLKSEVIPDLRTAANQYFERVTSPRPLLIEEVTMLPGNEKDMFTVFTAQVSLSSLTNP